MNRKCVSREVLIGLVVATAFSAQAAEPTGRSLPVYEVDRAWPKVPPQWKLGDPSSIAIDAKDNVWVLHRPRTLKPEQKAMAAPPVIVFDTAGTYIKAGGGAGDGVGWAGRGQGHSFLSHGLLVDCTRLSPSHRPLRPKPA